MIKMLMALALLLMTFFGTFVEPLIKKESLILFLRNLTLKNYIQVGIYILLGACIFVLYTRLKEANQKISTFKQSQDKRFNISTISTAKPFPARTETHHITHKGWRWFADLIINDSDKSVSLEYTHLKPQCEECRNEPEYSNKTAFFICPKCKKPLISLSDDSTINIDSSDFSAGLGFDDILEIEIDSAQQEIKANFLRNNKDFH